MDIAFWRNRMIWAICLIWLSGVGVAYSQFVVNDLLNPTTQADYVIISPPHYVPSVQELAIFRHSKNGYSVAIVITDTIYSIFGGGISPDSSVKKFIKYTLTGGWGNPTPRYFLLAGNVNDVPSHKEQGFILPPSIYEDSIFVDQWLIELGSDSTLPSPAACIGRFPASDSSTLAVMVTKTIAYESSADSSWMGRTLIVADYNDEVNYMFELYAQTLQENLVRTWQDTATVHVRETSPLHKSREEFRTLWNQGNAIVSLVGMANWMQFSRDAYFTTWDVDSLEDETPLVFFTMDQDQRFERTDTLAIVTRLLQAHSKGAVATLAPSGEVYSISQPSFLPSVFQSLSDSLDKPIGDVVLDIKLKSPFQGGVGFIRRYTLLGDPALVIRSYSLTGSIESKPEIPTIFHLYQNYPNPFNPTTTITLSVSHRSTLSVIIFDILGREIETLFSGRIPSGLFKLVWDTKTLNSGVYFYQVRTDEYMETKRMVLLR